jgi:hypothetical protein
LSNYTLNISDRSEETSGGKCAGKEQAKKWRMEGRENTVLKLKSVRHVTFFRQIFFALWLSQMVLDFIYIAESFESICCGYFDFYRFSV